jgi:hypothetical protein
MAKIEGPISGGRHGWPFGAATVDLAELGYVEEEYFVEGTAPRYRPVGTIGTDGHWAVEEAGTAPFKTRVVIRRPAEASRFNGTLVVEWNNVSAGSDIFEAGDTPGFLDEGFAYAGISAQRVGVHGFTQDPHGLVAWDPERYGDLHIADDSLAYGVFTEVARTVAAPEGGTDPLAGLRPTAIVAVGGSQSAGRLATYVNAVQPVEQLFDAFILFTWFGSGSSIDAPDVFDPSVPASLARMSVLPTSVRDDLDAKAMVVNSECETLGCVAVRQPDTDKFRFWEVAGAPHGPRLHMERILAKMARDEMNPPGGQPVDPASLHPVPWAPVLDAAMGHVHRWVNGGPPPPSQPLIEVEGDPPHIRRDPDGNAIGGVRVPEMEATLWRCIGAREESGEAGLMGVWSPLSSEVVRARYGDRDGYLEAFGRAADAAVGAGVLRAADGAAATERARGNKLL